MNRRRFLGMSAAVSGLLLLKLKTAFGYEANSAVRLGLLGCDRRGTTVATSFVKNTDARIVALADIFPDQFAKGKTHLDEVNAGLGHPAINTKLMFRGSSSRFHNQIANGVSNARSCMLSRRVAETGQEITWDKLQQNSEVYSLDMA